ncbi:MAG: PepSY domain-containing protein [Gemmatimonadota bacterium]
MSTLWITLSLATALILAGGSTAAQQPTADTGHKAAPTYKREVPDSLRAQAKVSEDSARGLALARTAGGTVQALELEREHGKLIWSFAIKLAGRPGITEVNVNALDGTIVGVEHEAH